MHKCGRRFPKHDSFYSCCLSLNMTSVAQSHVCLWCELPWGRVTTLKYIGQTWFMWVLFLIMVCESVATFVSGNSEDRCENPNSYFYGYSSHSLFHAWLLCEWVWPFLLSTTWLYKPSVALRLSPLTHGCVDESCGLDLPALILGLLHCSSTETLRPFSRVWAGLNFTSITGVTLIKIICGDCVRVSY